MAQVSRGVIFTYMFLMLVFGTANTMVGKLMDMTKSDGRNFQHPYFQTAVMFVGELLCLGIY